MIPQLISNDLSQVLIEQVGHELYNAHLYKYISAYLKNKGLDNVSKMFDNQFKEETEHAEMIIQLLTDTNTKFIMPSIDGCQMEFSTLLDIAQKYIDREIETTQSLIEIKRMAMDEDNGVVEERIRKMIKLQQHEYAEATTFYDNAEMIGSEWKFALLWDKSIG